MWGNVAFVTRIETAHPINRGRLADMTKSKPQETRIELTREDREPNWGEVYSYKSNPSWTIKPARKKAKKRAPKRLDMRERFELNQEIKRRAKTISNHASDIKMGLKAIMFDEPRVTSRELVAACEEAGAQVSIVTVSNIREQFWDTIKFLRAEGIANLPERKSNP